MPLPLADVSRAIGPGGFPSRPARWGHQGRRKASVVTRAALSQTDSVATPFADVSRTSASRGSAFAPGVRGSKGWRHSSVVPRAAPSQAETVAAHIADVSGAVAELSRQDDLAASGQWATAVACLVLLAPAFVPSLLRLARRYLKPRKCYECLGVGCNLCAVCKGRGKRGGLITGLPLSKCPGCRGRGRELCRSCRGVGLANSWLYVPARDSTAWGPRGQ